MARVLRGVFVAVVVMTGVVVAAPPAGAHGFDGVEATNYETRILEIEPSFDGLELRPVDLGEQLELRSSLDVDVIVLGYYGEPYLRVGPDGTFENRASESWELNRDPDMRSVGAITPVEDLPDADAEPDWVRTGSGDTLRWHDHRTHWMSDRDPESVRDDPASLHSVSEFELGLLVDGEPVSVRGEIVWVPPPPLWPALLATVVLAGVIVAASRTSRWPVVFAAALGVLAVSEMVHLIGAWGSTTATVASRLGASAYSLLAVALLVGALGWLLRARDPHDATPVVMVAGLVTFIAGGVADVSVLNHSQLATDLTPWLARTTVILAAGLGAGLTVGAGLRLRRPATQRPGV